MMTPRTWGLRAYVCTSVLITAVIAMLDPLSQHREVLEMDGRVIGATAAVILLLVSLIGWSDIVVNDWLPTRFSIEWTHEYRHMVFVAIAISQLALIFALFHDGTEWRPVMLRYGVDGLFAVIVACSGVLDHYRKQLHCRLQTLDQRLADDCNQKG